MAKQDVLRTFINVFLWFIERRITHVNIRHEQKKEKTLKQLFDRTLHKNNGLSLCFFVCSFVCFFYQYIYIYIYIYICISVVL